LEYACSDPAFRCFNIVSHPPPTYSGPIYLADYIGLDTCLSIIQGWQKTDTTGRFFVPKNLEKLVAEGKLGRKSGEGFYGKEVWGK
jgi:3-hydroxyacyl-CoA dehydrogenase